MGNTLKDIFNSLQEASNSFDLKGEEETKKILLNVARRLGYSGEIPAEASTYIHNYLEDGYD